MKTHLEHGWKYLPLILALTANTSSEGVALQPSDKTSRTTQGLQDL